MHKSLHADVLLLSEYTNYHHSIFYYSNIRPQKELRKRETLSEESGEGERDNRETERGEKREIHKEREEGAGERAQERSVLPPLG